MCSSDLSILELGDGVFEVLSTNGDTKLGKKLLRKLKRNHIYLTDYLKLFQKPINLIRKNLLNLRKQYKILEKKLKIKLMNIKIQLLEKFKK